MEVALRKEIMSLITISVWMRTHMCACVSVCVWEREKIQARPESTAKNHSLFSNQALQEKELEMSRLLLSNL